MAQVRGSSVIAVASKFRMYTALAAIATISKTLLSCSAVPTDLGFPYTACHGGGDHAARCVVADRRFLDLEQPMPLCLVYSSYLDCFSCCSLHESKQYFAVLAERWPEKQANLDA